MNFDADAQARETPMLTLNGSTKRLCNGVTRRDLLQIGGIGALGLGLGGPSPLGAAPSVATGGQAPRGVA
ncbi:MAG: hypothetical protein DWH84_02850, partial [Planctomycetota bacterium]